MSFKPKFRSRKLDYKKPLALVEADGIADIDDEAYRAIPVVSTGVEKEEEEVFFLGNMNQLNLKGTSSPSGHFCR